MAVPGSIQGVSLLPVLAGRKKRPGFVFSQNPREYARYYRSLRADRWKYIVDDRGREELYDLRLDPGELRNVAPQNADLVSFLGSKLAGGIWTAGHTREVEEIDYGELDEKVRENLRKLGYIQ